MSDGETRLYPELTRAVRDMLAASDKPMSRYAAELIRLGAEVGKALDKSYLCEDCQKSQCDNSCETHITRRAVLAKLKAAGLVEG